MCIKLIRTFHAVGQGAFYSECFKSENKESFNVVYDCGALPKSKSIENVIKGSFNSGETIDILFISHFDSDHVNGISVLKEKVSIKNVVLPLLDEKERIFLASLYKCLGENYREVLHLLEDAETFFGDGTNIIRVREITEDRAFEPININELSNGEEINSGTELICNLKDYREFWVYKPYNYKFRGRWKALTEALDKANISKKDLKNPDFIVRHSDEIRNIYKSKIIDGNINENSMLVCSIPWNSAWRCQGYYFPCISRDREIFHDYYSSCIACDGEIFHDYYSSCISCDRGIFQNYYFSSILRDIMSRHFDNRLLPGCIYTGDAELSKIKKNFLKSCNGILSKVGTVQVAHHGSYKNFDIDFFNGIGKRKNLICPVSFGSKNSYGHPSDRVLGELLSNRHYPVSINEFRGSSFIQVFELEYLR